MQKISRSAVEQHMNCQRCFYLAYKYKIRPHSLPFTLNSAVDNLCKNEFDHYRKTFSSSVEKIVTEFQMQKNGISFVSLKYTNLTKDFYVFNNGKNRKVLTWTIKSELDAEKIRNFCDNITFEGFEPI